MMSKQERQSRSRKFLTALLLPLLLLALACGCSSAPAEAPTQVVSSTPAPTDPPAPTATLSADDYVQQGRDYDETGDLDAALAAFQTALELEPGSAAAHAGLGLIYIDQGRFAEAVPEFEAALAFEPENEVAQGGICVANAFVNPEQAEGQCQLALAAHPENADLHNGLGVALAKQNRHAEAMAAFEQAIQLDPDHDWAHYNLGYLYLQLDSLAEAVFELNEAVRVSPENVQALYNLGVAYARQNDFSLALPVYEEAIRLDPELAAAYYDLGVIYREMGQAEQAIAAFERFLELEPDSGQREIIETEIAMLSMPAELPPGNSFEFEEVLDYNSEDDADFFSFFHSPAVIFASAEDTISIRVQPQDGLDVAIALLDTSTGDKVFITEANEAGLGGEEILTMTLPEPGPQMGVYAISIIAVEGSGSYLAAFSGTPAIGFFLSAGWEVNGVLGEQLALFYVVSALGKAGETIYIEAVPRPADNLDLSITAVDTSGNVDLGTLDESGPNEAEGDGFSADSTVYIFIVNDQDGKPGHLVMKYEQ